ncbi:hypothetical protein RHSIM_Rhsim05G0234200 [Rhododendron simsii]|uniref:Uncharacterized protein n=1 Tax=Rhododendron simsii TaxID=118357 RepID=A0A834LK71_RHOSS|nr:hypothetical protein RHSIM_Rhsim05G0234200 [Rhododendron simsii]
MESKTLEYSGNPDDHQERLITFSTLDLNDSSIEFFSEDDEEETSYIEIALDEPLALSMIPQLCNQQGEAEGENAKEKSKENSTTTGDYPDNQELEFRISPSPLVSTFPGFPSSTSPTLSSSTNTNNTTTSTSSSECSPAAADGYAIKSLGSPPKGQYSKFSPMPIIGSSTGNNKRKKQFPAFHRLLNVLLSAFKQSSLENTKESGSPDGYDDDKKTDLNATGSWEVVRNRKTSEPLTTAVNNGGGGGVMKLIIKFKSMSIRSGVASLLKPQQGVISPGGNNTSQQNKRGPNKQRLIKNYRIRIMKLFDKRTPVKPTNHQEDQSNFNRSSNMDKYSLDAIRGMLESLSVIKIGRSKGKQMSKSCSNSIKSSPIQGGEVLVPKEARKIYTRDNSVQAAIAHCKSSFGQMNSG